MFLSEMCKNVQIHYEIHISDSYFKFCLNNKVFKITFNSNSADTVGINKTPKFHTKQKRKRAQKVTSTRLGGKGHNPHELPFGNHYAL